MAGNSFPDFGLTHEERRRAVLGHYYEQPGMDGARGEIWCYTDRYSYRAGDTITLFVSSTGGALPARYRAGRRRRNTRVDCRRFERAGGRIRRTNVPSWVAAGKSSHSFRIPTDWSSGAYRITLTAEGRDGRLIRYHHLFILRPNRRSETRPHPAGRRNRHVDRL